MQRRPVARFGARWLLVVGIVASCGGDAGSRAVPGEPPVDAAPPPPRPSLDAAPGDPAPAEVVGDAPAAEVAPADGDGEDRIGPGDGGDLAGGDGPAGAIAVENLAPGETVPHDLVVLQGTAAGSSLDLELGGQTSRWPVVGGQFRVLALLKTGPNQLVLTAGTARLAMSITYRPPTTGRYVRFLYIVAADGDGRFEGPTGEVTDQASALARMQVGARMIQTFLAETMRRAGFGRMTFRLARDQQHEPIIEVFKSRLTTAAARGMEGNALWSAFYQELGSLPDRTSTLDVAVMSMTHYLPATRVTQAHTALGGGRLGLFGSGTLYAHAASIAEIPARFADARAVNVAQVRDDSAGRGSYWANYATGLGAMAHELGHCLGLPHPGSHRGLMWRGFDNLNRTFVIAEPGLRGATGLAPLRPTDEAGLDRSNAVRLRFQRWMAADPIDYGSDPPPAITVIGGALRISSAAGVRHVQYIVGGEAVAHDEYLSASPPTTVDLPLAALRTRLGGAAIVDVSTVDDDGNVAGRDRLPLP